ncbi:MAG: hypothetical protein RLY20_1867, partial [Verrucomicrobiota bacterium]
PADEAKSKQRYPDKSVEIADQKIILHLSQKWIAANAQFRHKGAPHPGIMSKKTNKLSKPKKNEEAALLDLLKRVLPKVALDPEIAGKIYQACEAELKSKSRETAFEKFCEHVELPNLEEETLDNVRLQLASSFTNGDITIKPNKKEDSLGVEVALPDGSNFQSSIKVRPVAPEEDGEQEVPLKFVAFPVSLPGDPELVWAFAKTENLSAEEAGMALTKCEEEFWASKQGQKLQRDRVERSFPEFVSRAPAALLREVGLKRHYKMPEPVKVLRPLKQPKAQAA